ncbi:serine/threonine-protein kinase [Nonomuraea sp. NPDC050547]|uniref:serine/threonine-protein kinase n=1 Tax=unclassified Nonomuraea TaxID=2593643 RepID=UPI0037BBB8ED
MPGSQGFEDWLLGGRYRLQAELGRGGMGRVWRGHDELLDRAVAVKEVILDRRPPGDRAALLGRTMSEARLAARLSHPHIAAVYDVVEADGRPWIVLQLIPAPTLADVLAERGPLPPADVAGIGLQVLEALQAAHAAGIVHRDVKPANILLADAGRHAVLTDFGLATTLMQPAQSGLTQADIVVGTPAYISPERARGAAPTAESDLWSLGVTLFTAVEGRCPFEQGSPLATISAVLTADPVPFVRAGPLAPLLTGLLVKDPARRTGVDDARRRLRHITAPPASPAVAAPSATASPAVAAPSATEPTPPRTHPTGPRPTAVRAPAPARHAADPAARAPWIMYAAAVSVLAAGVLAAANWPDGPTDTRTAGRPSPGTPATTAPTSPAALLQLKPGSTRRGRHQTVGPARVPAVDSMPPGQAKKLTGDGGGKVKHGHKLHSPGKGHK